MNTSITDEPNRRIFSITPLPNCRFCYGTGEVAERHPYGSTYATEYLTCDCVLEQLPEDFQDGKDEVEIHCIGIEDGPEFEYDEELDKEA